LKGWSVTLVAALFALAARDANSRYVYIAYLPVLSFWGLDGYFLMMERQFRSHYDRVRQTPPAETDFSMQIERGGVREWARSSFGHPMCLFHSVLLLSLIMASIISK